MQTDPRRGVILVAVLWTVALLSALAMATSVTFREFAGIISVDRDRLRADALLTAGLETAAGVIARLPEDRPLPGSEMTFRLSTGQIRVRVTDEGGRIDIGKAPVEVLASLLRRVGAENADGIARSIVSWRTANGGAPPRAQKAPRTAAQDAGNTATTTGQNAQTAGQTQQANGQSQTTPQGTPQDKSDKAPSNAMPFTDIRQLLNVPGVTPDLVAAAAPYITVFGGEKLNALSASPAVLATLPGMNADRVASFVDARRNISGDGSQMHSMLGGAQTYVIADGKKVASVVVQARVTDGYSAAAQAVIVLSSQDAQPYRMLAWNPWPAALAKW